MFERIVSRPPALVLAAAVLLATLAGCNRFGASAPVAGAGVPSGDLAGQGAQAVISEAFDVKHRGQSLSIVVYGPAGLRSFRPAVVFLPGLMAADDQYESYARALASRGFIVAVHGWYSPFTSDVELAQHAGIIAEWLVSTFAADPERIGVAGHSMGGKDAVLAAARYGKFAGVVAIDPDDSGELSVVHDFVSRLRTPLLLIGAEVGWDAPSICAPREANYQRFFERAPPGTIELTLRNADHVQMLDDPDRFGYDICRSGTANSRQVGNTTRRATVAFFMQHLQNGPPLQKPLISQALMRVAQAGSLGRLAAN